MVEHPWNLYGLRSLNYDSVVRRMQYLLCSIADAHSSDGGLFVTYILYACSVIGVFFGASHIPLCLAWHNRVPQLLFTVNILECPHWHLY